MPAKLHGDKAYTAVPLEHGEVSLEWWQLLVGTRVPSPWTNAMTHAPALAAACAGERQGLSQ